MPLTNTLTKQIVDEMLDAMSRVPKHMPDTIIMAPYAYDSMKAEMDVLNRFSGRNWRRIKRERRKAHDAVKRKHTHRPQVAFAVDSDAMTFNWSRQIKVDEW